MNRSSPRRLGTAFIKAAFLVVKGMSGEEQADALLEAGWLTASDIENETESVPWTAGKPILERYAELLGASAAEKLAHGLVEAHLLGHWGGSMRSAKTLEELFRAPPTSLFSDEEIPFLVTVAASGPNHLEAKVTSSKGDTPSDSALLAAAAELGAVPLIFGEKLVRASILQGGRVRLEWEKPSGESRVLIGAITSGLVAVGIFSLGRPLVGAFFVVIAAALALFHAASSRRTQRTASTGDDMRRQILERTMALKEKASESEVAGSAEGRVLAGQFRIDKPLASGATGIVYRGRRIEDGRPVAIKLLRAAAVHDHAASARLRREAEALGLAWHPNVVEVIDHGVLPEGTSYLVMELLEGESYFDFLKSKGSLLPIDLLPLAVQMTEALVAIHAAGIVHRDLKPANIFLVGEKRDQVKLIDFGIARVEWEEMRITALGAPLGTPGYMSPEQAIGKEVDARTDLYSLGAILYESLMGDPPPPARAGNWSGGIDVRVEEGLSGLSERWQGLLRSALAPLDERFASSKQMLESLRAMASATAIPVTKKGDTGT